VAVVVPLSPLGSVLGFGALPIAFWLLLVGIVAAYLTMVEIAKRIYDNHEAGRAASVAAAPAAAPRPAAAPERAVTNRRPAR
jgi:Mg2+-importing ATPase